jgi:hypothetical protein
MYKYDVFCVSDHGAFVARLLPHDQLEVISWAREDARGHMVRVPPFEVGVNGSKSLGEVEDDLVLLTEDWWVLGLRWMFDYEARRVAHSFCFQVRGFSVISLFRSATGQYRMIGTTCGHT